MLSDQQIQEKLDEWEKVSPGWESPPPGTRFKLHPETIDWYLQHTTDQKFREFLLRHKTNVQNSSA